jgi:hypothetical protein
MKTWLACKLLGQICHYDEKRPGLYAVLTDALTLTNADKQERRVSVNNSNMAIAVRNVSQRDTNIIKEWARRDYTTSLIVGSAPLPIDMFS